LLIRPEQLEGFFQVPGAHQRSIPAEQGRKRLLPGGYAHLVQEHAPNAQRLFDRFHIVQHLNEAVDCFLIEVSM
jgi:hypothetical protein